MPIIFIGKKWKNAQNYFESAGGKMIQYEN
jgi:hypothetical protein